MFLLTIVVFYLLSAFLQMYQRANDGLLKIVLAILVSQY